LWAKNIGHPDNHYGHSSSLIIHKNIVVVQFDHNLKASVMAFNTRTGEMAWETIRTGAKISWASPVISTFNGKEQVILTSDPYVAGYDLTNGAELWRARGVSAEIGPSVAVNSTTVFAGNEFAKLVAIKPGAGDTPLWQDNEFLPEVASPVATENHLFVATSFGAVACYDTKTGKVVWEHYFDYGFYASPIIADGNVYLMDVAGVMQVFRAGGTFELLASSPLGEKSVCTPAFAHGKIFMRGSQHIYCIGKN
jgi:outer membrane protein assembly factor BamB